MRYFVNVLASLFLLALIGFVSLSLGGCKSNKLDALEGPWVGVHKDKYIAVSVYRQGDNLVLIQGNSQFIFSGDAHEIMWTADKQASLHFRDAT